MKRLITIGVALLLGVTSATVKADTGFSFSIGTEGVSMSVNSYSNPYRFFPRGHRYYRPAPPPHHRHGKKAIKKYYKKQRKLDEKYRKESYKNYMKYYRHGYRHHHDD